MDLSSSHLGFLDAENSGDKTKRMMMMTRKLWRVEKARDLAEGYGFFFRIE